MSYIDENDEAQVALRDACVEYETRLRVTSMEDEGYGDDVVGSVGIFQRDDRDAHPVVIEFEEGAYGDLTTRYFDWTHVELADQPVTPEAEEATTPDERSTPTVSTLSIPESCQIVPGKLAGQVNIRFDLIDAQIAWAEAEEAKGEESAWNQARWATTAAPCGTAYCIAGHVVADVLGGVPVFEHGVISTSLAELPGAVRVDIADTARNELGFQFALSYLEQVQSERYSFAVDYEIDYDREEFHLFAGLNKIPRLKRIRDTYALVVGVPLRYEGQSEVLSQWTNIVDEAKAQHNAEAAKQARKAELAARVAELQAEIVAAETELASL